MAYGIDNLTNGRGTYAEVVINGGTVKSPYRAIRQFLNGVEAQNILTINGGTIEGANKSIWMQGPSANANSGKLTVEEGAAVKGDIYLTSTAGAPAWPVEVSIAASALQGEAKVLTSNIPDGYEVTENNGTYGVIEVVAKIGETPYSTLQAAINAASIGATITVVDDVTEDVNVNKDLTIDGNGKKYTGNINVKGSAVDAIIKNVNFVDGNGYAITSGGSKSITVENCTVDNYNYGFLYVKSATPTIIVNDVTVSNCNYGFHYVYGSTATVTNVEMTNVDNGIYIQNYANKTVTVKDSKISSIAIWERTGKSGVQTIKFEGANEVATMTTSQYAKYYLASGATLAAPEGLLDKITTDEGYMVHWDDGVYKAFMPVAKVGEVAYESLAAAIAAAGTGDIVTLLTDISLSDADIQTVGSYKVMFNVDGKDITLDMNDNEISVDGYTGTSYTNLIAVVRVADGAGLTVTGNGTIDIPSNGENIAYMFWKAGTTGHLTIKNGTFHMDNSADSMVYTNGHEIVTVKGGDWTLDEVGTRTNRFPCIFSAQGSGGKSIIVSGGTYNDDINHQHWGDEAVVPATHYVVDNGDGTWTVTEGAVASVNLGTLTGPYFVAKEFGFATFKEAMAAAGEGNTVTLLAHVALDEQIINTEKITLNLNGKTITGTDNSTGSFGLITNKGKLTITGNGTIALTATNNRGWNGYSSVISNQPGGMLIVENGTIVHQGGTDMAYGIDNLTNGKGTYAEVIINGGTVKSTYRAIRQFLNGVEADNILTVNGGIIEGTNKSIWMQGPSANANSGKLTVENGATLNGDVYMSVTAGTPAWPVDVSIFADAVNGEVLTANLPEGYFVENNGGFYCDVKYDFKSGNGKAFYATLQAAINDYATNGGQIALLGDVVNEPSITISNNVNINFNGFTYTGDITIDNSNAVVGFLNGGTIDGSVTANAQKLTLSNAMKVTGTLTATGASNVVMNADSTVGALVLEDNATAKITSGASAVSNNAVALAGNVYYTNFAAAAEAGGTVTLLANAEGRGAVINSDTTINFNGFTYTFTEGVGSTGTKTNGFQILTGNKVALKNGTLKVADSAADKFYILIQNYADLTVTDMTLDGTNLDRYAFTDGDSYVLSNNSGNITLNGSTVIIKNNDGDKAVGYDVYDSSYYEGAPVVNDKTGSDTTVEAAAKVGTRVYATLQQAIDDKDNTSANDAIVLLSDIVLDETLTIPVTKKAIVLDLNGFTISQVKACDSHYSMIVNNNKALTIKDTVGGGKISFKDTGAGDPNFGWGSYTIENNGQLILLSGTIANETAMNGNGVVHMYCAIQQGNTAAHTQIRGGSVTSVDYRSIRINAGKLTVNAGEIEGQIWVQPYTTGINVTLNGGSFCPKGEDYSSVYVDNSSKTVTFRVNGGTFATKIGCAAPTATGLKNAIRGGSFTDEAIAGTNAALFYKTFVNTPVEG